MPKTVHTDIGPWSCSFRGCSFRTKYRNVIKSHTQRHETTTRSRDFQCALCPSSFYTKVELHAHIPRHTNERSFTCKLCNYRAITNIALQIHVQRLHGESVKQKCGFPGCSYTAKQRSSVLVHRQSRNTDPLLRRPFPCKFPGCSYRAITNLVIKRHYLARHDPNRKRDFPCPMCPKTFFTSKSLKAHTICHTREKHFSCDKCDFITSLRETFKVHWRNMHGTAEKRFKCGFYDYRADQKTIFDIHVKTAHSDRRDFQCENPCCDYKTNNSGAFRRHLLSHEKDPKKRLPYQCTFPACDFRGRRKSKIKAHEGHHLTSQIELHCEFCPKTYPDRDSLCFHYRVIHKKKRFRCRFCEYTTSFGFWLDRHLSLEHGQLNNVKGAKREQERTRTIRCKGRQVIDGEGTDIFDDHQAHSFVQANGYCRLKLFTQGKVPVVAVERIFLEIV